ncbi:CYFA0S10e03334g1_1 [Cyberlindnera fabianii]|uniref:CYFA0S10e03334g1_1 n=1 Tax=Cyberlindnera fabianii TaxID=36022 RepID=A0A061AZ79_CYBFA|nr:CYFA0S10e03334g1_1 [Cyberlindnera fabianii]
MSVSRFIRSLMPSTSQDKAKEAHIVSIDSHSSLERGQVEHTTLNAIQSKTINDHGTLRKHFNIWSLLGVGFGLTNSWFGISASLVAGISSGGPMLIVYGIVIITFIASCIGISLSELISAFPENSGGQYYWTFQLAPKKYRRFWAYMCGSYAWFGSIFTSASVTVSIAAAVVGMYYLSTGKTEAPKTWEVFVTFEVFNAFLALFNIWDKPLPAISSAALYTSLLSFVVISLTVLICARGHYQDAHFVFVQFNNGTGWSSSGVAFIVGLINPAWSFSCLDCATHMAEEMYEPERWIPISIMSTVAIGFGTSFCYSIAMFFSIRNLDDILNSVTGVPIMDIFYQALGNKHGALFLEALIVLTAIGCNVASQTWMARLCWSFSRDRGLPGSRYWSVVNESTRLPVNAHLMSCFWCAVIGCIYMGSTTAYNAMVVGCITFLLLSYAIPIVCLLVRGRSTLKHGPFWLGPIGLAANLIVLAWTVFAVVFFSFPMSMPVAADSMNYASVVLAAFTIYSIVYWFVRGNKTFALDYEDEEVEDDIDLSVNAGSESKLGESSS